MNDEIRIACPVSSYNEWDPLEEVVVGCVRGAAVPPWHESVKACAPPATWEFVQALGGQSFPEEEIAAAEAEVNEFVHILQAEGVTVRRPDALDFARAYATPDWTSDTGFCVASPRDALLVVGDEIIEAPMGWRSRYFEANAYRGLIKDYFRRGARWTAAPKPELKDELYDPEYRVPEPGEPVRYVLRELEPTFDAADFARCGRDIFALRSNVTNQFGIDWLRRHLGDDYRIHLIESHNPQPMHIDTTFVPLAPGKALINPEFVRETELPEALRKWEIRSAPPPVRGTGVAADLHSAWMSMNMLVLDEKRVIVERNQLPMQRALQDWGFTPIPCAFENYYGFGGSFHCATVDIRRRGRLQSYC